MTIQLPKTVQHLVGKISEEKLILIALLHHLRKEFGVEWYSLYRYDITLIITEGLRYNDPHKIFTGLTSVIKVRYVNDYKLDLKLKRWTNDEFDYVIQDFRHVIIWSHILDQGNLEETPDNTLHEMWWIRSNRKSEALARILKIDYLEYERNRIRR